jgi:hypothetical protein
MSDPIPPEPRAAEPLPPPRLYAVELPVGMHSAWRNAVRALDHTGYARTLLAAGLAPDGKEALIAWLCSDATRDALAAFRLRHRAERDRLLAQDLGCWDAAHVRAVEAALADPAKRARLVDLMLRELRRQRRG